MAVAGLYHRVFTVLTEGTTNKSPIAGSSARAILDGHIVLSRRLAEAGHYPAIGYRGVNQPGDDRALCHRAAPMRAARIFKTKLLSSFQRTANSKLSAAPGASSDPMLDKAITYGRNWKRFTARHF